MCEYDIDRIIWAKNAFKTIFIEVDDRFDENTPFDDYPSYISEDSRLLRRLVKS